MHNHNSKFPKTVRVTSPPDGITTPITVTFTGDTQGKLRRVILQQNGERLGEEWISRYADPTKRNALPLAKQYTTAPPLITITVEVITNLSLF